jgi:predicted ArsR family transcriptional regulator
VVYEATAAPDGDRNYRLLAEVLAQHIVATSERPGEAAVNAGRSWAVANGPERHQDGAEPGGDREKRDDGDGAGTAPISDDAAIAVIVKMLGDTGFAPEVSRDGTSINLHRCPFLELAVTNQDVVCGAHLGIIQGALAELGTMVSATRLIPPVTPGLCVTTLSRSPQT